MTSIFSKFCKKLSKPKETTKIQKISLEDDKDVMYPA